MAAVTTIDPNAQKQAQLPYSTADQFSNNFSYMQPSAFNAQGSQNAVNQQASGMASQAAKSVANDPLMKLVGEQTTKLVQDPMMGRDFTKINQSKVDELNRQQSKAFEAARQATASTANTGVTQEGLLQNVMQGAQNREVFKNSLDEADFAREQDARLKSLTEGRSTVTTQQDSNLKAIQGLATASGLYDPSLNRLSQETMQGKQIESTEKLASNELVENARQFDNKLDFDKWATEAGFDENAKVRAWQTMESDKALFQQAKQFNSKMEFDKWAVESGYDENEKARIWQGMQNQNQIDATKDLQNMTINQEQWMQGRVETMQKAGFTQEEAMQNARFEQETKVNGVQNELTRQLQRNELSQKQYEIAIQASQFNSKMEFDRWATQQGFNQQDKELAWQAGQNSIAIANDNYNADATRQLTKDIENGKLTLEQGRLAQDYTIFAQTMYDKGLDREQTAKLFHEQMQSDDFWKSKDIDMQKIILAQTQTEAANQRAWQSTENLLNRQLTKEGMDMDKLYNILQYTDEDSAAGIINKIATDAGITYIDENGVTKPGLGSSTKSALLTQKMKTIAEKYTAGERLTTGEFKELAKAIDAGGNDNLPFDVAKAQPPRTSNMLSWETDGSNRWVLADDIKTWVNANKGAAFKAENGKYYLINGVNVPSSNKNLNTRESISLTDLETGETISWADDTASSNGSSRTNRPLPGIKNTRQAKVYSPNSGGDDSTNDVPIEPGG